MVVPDIRVAELVGRTARDPVTDRFYYFSRFEPAAELGQEDWCGEMLVVCADGSQQHWFGHEIIMDFAIGRLELWAAGCGQPVGNLAGLDRLDIK